MPKITKQQYIDRWDALPPILREAMFSPANGELIWRIGEEHHLKDEQITKIVRICGNIVMGFLHREDLAKEIKTDLGIDERLALAISREIDRKVFSPLRSEIDKVYSPPAPVVEEIRMPETKEIEETKETEKLVETPAAEPITSEHKIDISEFKVIGPEEPSSASEVEPPLPPGLAEKPEEIKEEEIEKLEETKKPIEILAGEPEAQPASSPAEGPIIIHQEEEIKAVKEAPRTFSLGSIFGFFKKKKTKTTEPAVASAIELPAVSPSAELRATVSPSAELRASEVESPTKEESFDYAQDKPAKVVDYEYSQPALVAEPSESAESTESSELPEPSEPLLLKTEPEAPVAEAPAEETPAEETPVEETSVEETPAPLPNQVETPENNKEEKLENIIDLRSFEKK